MAIKLKINGLHTAPALQLALKLGISHIGLSFLPHPTRQISPEAAGDLVRGLPHHTTLVGILANPTDVELEACLAACPLDALHLHGQESPARVLEIKQQTQMPLMKTLRLRDAADVAQMADYVQAVDAFVYAAGATGAVQALTNKGGTPDDWAFDWSLLAAPKHHRPWFLAGGITAENMAAAQAVSHATAFDITSGVEHHPGAICLNKLEILANTAAKIHASVPSFS